MTRPNFSTTLRGSGLKSLNGGSTWTSTTSSQHRLCSEVVSGTHRRKPNGWIPPTPYDLTRTIHALATGMIKWVVIPSNQYWETGALTTTDTHVVNTWALYAPPATVDSDLYDQALIKARLKLKDQDINLGVAFAERKLTARLASDTFTSIAKSARALKHGQVRHAMNLLGISSRKREPRGKNVPQKWLELQYGWKPLLSDVYGAVSALDKRDRHDWRVTVKGRSSRKKQLLKSSSSSAAYYVDANISEEQGCLIRIDAVPSEGSIAPLVSLGVTNPLSIAWEIVPFSFVVDWALPVGDYLNQLDAMVGYNSNETYTSVTRFRRTRWDTTFRTLGKYNFQNRLDMPCYKESLRVNRTAGTGVPFPVRPHLKDPASLSHLANALSLLTQVFKR